LGSCDRFRSGAVGGPAVVTVEAVAARACELPPTAVTCSVMSPRSGAGGAMSRPADRSRGSIHDSCGLARTLDSGVVASWPMSGWAAFGVDAGSGV